MGYVMAAQFKREKNSDWEWGFDINETVLLDREGKVIEEVYDIHKSPYQGAFHLPSKSKD